MNPDTIDKYVDKYVQNIKYGTSQQQQDTPVKSSATMDIFTDEIKISDINNKFDKEYKSRVVTNNNKNEKYIEEQIRLNNLQEINHSKQITIYIMYFILLVSVGLLIYLLKY